MYHRTVYGAVSYVSHTHTVLRLLCLTSHIKHSVHNAIQFCCVCVCLCCIFASLTSGRNWMEICVLGMHKKRHVATKCRDFSASKTTAKCFFFCFTQYHKKYALVCQRPIINIHHFPSKTIAINCGAKSKHREGEREKSERCSVEQAAHKRQNARKIAEPAKKCEFSSLIHGRHLWPFSAHTCAYMAGLRCESGERITSSFTNECAMWESLKNAFEHVHMPLKCTHIWLKRLQCFPF